MHQPSDHPDAQAKAAEPDPKVAEPSDVADASADASPKPAPTDSIEVAAKESPEPAPVQAAAAPPEALRASVPSAVPARKGGVSPPTQVTTNLKAGGARQRSEPPSEGAEALWGGRVRILDELGRGAMGTVLRAQDVKLQRELALKVASTPRNQMPPALLARFVEEVQITAQLEHPNVVPVHDLGIDPDGRAYFSMKLVHGQSLEEILDKRAAGDQKTLGEFGLRRLLDVFLQVCQAIEYAHARGVIHRDLKPANIMVGDFGEVLVMDWGVAKLLGHSERDDFSDQISQTGNESVPPGSAKDTSAPRSAKQSIAPRSAKQSIPPRTAKESIAPSDPVRSVRGSNQAFATQRGALIGTPAYMSPEQAAGRPADQRSDVYSLGVILFEILCGQVPFDDDDPKVVVARVLEQQPPRPSEIKRAVPPGLETLCLRLLEKDPAQRTITIPTIRAHVHNYIEGIGRDYGRESLWTTVGWSVGAFLLFAFLVWYLTGEPVAVVLALGPPAFLNAVGWFLVVLALGYPLWAIYAGFRQSRVPADRFKPPDPAQIFVSGYLAHRTFAASVAPLFQLIFIIELLTVAVVRAS
ncbi:MAG TPA: protein kinase, partial [Polyangiaceae bacterium]